ncbi:transcription factor FER-LIKE IRON DEFICIENCY-INDUCED TRANSCRIPTION FACTOR [Olea europaea subsp. europaea]|uniref:Transcription factor FER-LIKE IRON DEFICIENCY-INDUCED TRANSCRIPTION FACTOR n=1 Tax=Olea europaea subsp. europaea TaxID=158383 RepID=A0A8S0UXM8_OLEEU|nr:transcription factor FER-LIKE IRON DEFICIENCY-INDUCED TRANSCRIPTION FACTOR [Olea europaea subsp. europaea]
MASHFPLENVTDFGLIDFLDEANFNQFIELIRGENEDPIVNFSQNYDYDLHIAGCLAENQFVPGPVELFDFDIAANPNLDCAVYSLPQDTKAVEEENDEEESSATTTKSTKSNKKVDRSRTLISERRRRGRMKEKLYALRSLVPNITKMDKASIVGDAVVYLQELQMQAKKLKAEVASLESSLTRGDKCQGGNIQATSKMNATNFYPVIKKILKMDVIQVEERGFYVRLVCNKGQGVSVSLFKALESLISFNVQSSNLATSADNFVMTFTLHVRDSEVDMNLPNLKLWIASAFLNQGFDFATSPSAMLPNITLSS